jgi:hypothetical protein
MRLRSGPTTTAERQLAFFVDARRHHRRHSGGKGQYGRAMLIPDTVLPVYTGDRAIRFSRAVSSRRAGGPVVGGRSALGDG